MNTSALQFFFARLAEDPDLRRDFTDLARRHGIEFGSGELSEAELDAVAGGVGSTDTQSSQQDLAAAAQSLSKILKSQHDTAKAIISNLRA